MALVIFHDGTRQTVKPETAHMVWQVLNGKIEADEKQTAFVERVQAVYLNWRTAPDDYIEANKDLIFRTAIRGWMRDGDGNFTRPDPSDQFAVDFAKRWNLLSVIGDRSGLAKKISDELNRKIYRG